MPVFTEMTSNESNRPFSFLVTVLAGAPAGLLVRQLLNHKTDYRYTGTVIRTLLVSTILEPFRWWEIIRWRRKVRKVVISKPPVFVIGFWRSGTTLLHNLLCCLPDAAYVTTFQTVFPGLLLSGSWWFKPIIGKFWPTHRPFDQVRMGMHLPQEEEIALANLQRISFYNFLIFPKDFERFYHRELFFHDIDRETKIKWIHKYMELIRKAMMNTGGDRLISKSPSNMARIPALLEMFPGARFIFLYRDPYTTVESFYRFFHEVLPVMQLQDSGNILSRDRMARVYADMVRQYLDDKYLIPKENLVELRYEQFLVNIRQELQEVCQQLGIPGFEEARPQMEKYLNETAGHRKSGYKIHADTIKYINQYASDIVEFLGYPHRLNE